MDDTTLRQDLQRLLQSLLSEPSFSSSSLTVQSPVEDFHRFLSPHTVTVTVVNFTGTEVGMTYVEIKTLGKTSGKELCRAVERQWKGRKIHWKGVWRRYMLGSEQRPYGNEEEVRFEGKERVRFHIRTAPRLLNKAY